MENASSQILSESLTRFEGIATHLLGRIRPSTTLSESLTRFEGIATHLLGRIRPSTTLSESLTRFEGIAAVSRHENRPSFPILFSGRPLESAIISNGLKKHRREASPFSFESAIRSVPGFSV